MQKQIRNAEVTDGAEELRKKIEEIATRMLEEGKDTGMVSRVTGLSMDQVAILKNKL